MANVYVNPVTDARLKLIQSDVPDSLLLTGPEGVGLTAIALSITSTTKAIIYTVLPERDEKVDIEKGTITVESIRRLYALTRTIEPQGRFIIIDYAERMGTAAQNAFLKLLEEPGQGTHFILLTHQPSQLLPTILSRVQRTDIRPITTEQSEALLDELSVNDARQRSQLLFIARGLPAELTRLVTDEEYFVQRSTIVKDARQYIVGSAYDKLLIAKKYKDDRKAALTLLEDAMKLIQKTITDGGSAAGIASLTRLQELYDRVLANGNIRLQLAAAVV